MKIPWQAALGMVFCSGALFLALTFTGLRRKNHRSHFPLKLMIAISCGIGLFIAFIGLKNGGIIAIGPVHFVKAGTFV